MTRFPETAYKPGFRTIGINQAHIASLDRPIVNTVTGEAITDNTNDNATLRAPLQGVDPGGFALNKSAAQSSYDSLQLNVNRRLSQDLQFSAAYTFSKSIDNGSNPGGGTNSDGTFDRSGGLDSSGIWGDQLSARGNRGLSDFDRTHFFAFQGLWSIPTPNPLHATSPHHSLCFGRSKGAPMTSEERERLNVPCELLQKERDPRKFTKLLTELDQLLQWDHIVAKNTTNVPDSNPKSLIWDHEGETTRKSRLG